nr:preprotein translocase subunit YajC [Parachlamydia acanthamoebae]
MKKLLYFLIMAQMMVMETGLLAVGEEDLPPSRDQSFWQTLVMIGVLLMCFYVILWRPEQKRRKAMEEQRSALKKGDRVVAMGIVGTIDKILEQTVILRMVDGSKIEVIKAGITEVLSGIPGEDIKDVKSD